VISSLKFESKALSSVDLGLGAFWSAELIVLLSSLLGLASLAILVSVGSLAAVLFFSGSIEGVLFCVGLLVSG
jgi:hypothetical protein